MRPLSPFPARMPQTSRTLLSYARGAVTGLGDPDWLFGRTPAHLERAAPEGATVTALIPAYNEEKHLEDAVKSLLAQSYKLFSIVIINDGSKDKTGLIAERLVQDNRGLIYVIHTRGTGSKSGALNMALESDLPMGELVVVMDGDTTFEPDAIKHTLSHFYDPAVA